MEEVAKRGSETWRQWNKLESGKRCRRTQRSTSWSSSCSSSGSSVAVWKVVATYVTSPCIDRCLLSLWTSPRCAARTPVEWLRLTMNGWRHLWLAATFYCARRRTGAHRTWVDLRQRQATTTSSSVVDDHTSAASLFVGSSTDHVTDSTWWGSVQKRRYLARRRRWVRWRRLCVCASPCRPITGCTHSNDKSATRQPLSTSLIHAPRRDSGENVFKKVSQLMYSIFSSSVHTRTYDKLEHCVTL